MSKPHTFRVPTESIFAMRATGARVDPQEACVAEVSNGWRTPREVTVQLSGDPKKILEALAAAERFRNMRRHS